jgi:hypothetical protein
MYRPNFCAECGERVQRARWRVWTSRRFCAACEVRFRRRSAAATLAACACLVALGFAAGRGVRPSRPPLVVIHGGSADGGNRVAGAGPQAAAGGAQVSDDGSDGTTAERPTDSREVVSVCGARTKKGTPCSRRVRGTGRCWQHRGKPAMLPAERLIVPG